MIIYHSEGRQPEALAEEGHALPWSFEHFPFRTLVPCSRDLCFGAPVKMGTSVIITMSKCISCILVLVIVFILWAHVEISMVAFFCLSTENCCVISCMLLVVVGE